MDTLKNTVESLAKRIKAPLIYLTTFGHSEDGARPHIEKQGNEYHWVVIERGEELNRKRTKEIKELLFWIFDAVTFEMAVKLELKNRKQGEDFRVQMFRIQEELIREIDPDFEKIIKEKHQKLLKEK